MSLPDLTFSGMVWTADSPIAEADKKVTDAKALAIALVPPVLPSGSIRKTLGERAEKNKAVPYALHLEFTRGSKTRTDGLQQAAQTATLDTRTKSVRTDVLDESLFVIPANFKELKEEKPQIDPFEDVDARQRP